MPVAGIVAAAVLGVLRELFPDLGPGQPFGHAAMLSARFRRAVTSTWRLSDQPTRTPIGCSWCSRDQGGGRGVRRGRVRRRNLRQLRPGNGVPRQRALSGGHQLPLPEPGCTLRAHRAKRRGPHRRPCAARPAASTALLTRVFTPTSEGRVSPPGRDLVGIIERQAICRAPSAPSVSAGVDDSRCSRRPRPLWPLRSRTIPREPGENSGSAVAV